MVSKIMYAWDIPVADLEVIQDDLRAVIRRPSLYQTETQAELQAICRKLVIVMAAFYTAREPSPEELKELDATETEVVWLPGD